MSTVNARRDNDFLTRVGSRITVWVLGAGLLSLHATIFTLTMIGMVFWNIYDAPTDLWVADLFRRWGVLLLFHGVAVAAGWTAWRLLRAEQHAIDANRTDWTAPRDQPYQPVEISSWQPAGQPQHSEASRINSTLQQTGRSLKQFVAYSALWTSRLGRAASSASHSVSSKLSANKGGPAISPNAQPTIPVQVWPEGPIRTVTDEDELIARFGGNGSASAGFTSTPDFASYVPPVESAIADPTVPSIGKDASQTWVEAATAGWLMPREGEIPETPPVNGNHSAKNGSTPAPSEPPT